MWSIIDMVGWVLPWMEVTVGMPVCYTPQCSMDMPVDVVDTV